MLKFNLLGLSICPDGIWNRRWRALLGRQHPSARYMTPTRKVPTCH